MAYSASTSPSPSLSRATNRLLFLSLLVQDRRMLINKLPAIQLSSKMEHGSGSVEKCFKQQQVPLPNVDLFVCLVCVCECPEAHVTCTCRSCQLRLQALPCSSRPPDSRQLSLSARVARSALLLANYQTNGQAESLLPQTAERVKGRARASERVKQIKTLNGLPIK